MTKKPIHHCIICGKSETCKGEHCGFIEMLSAHGVCFVRSKR